MSAISAASATTALFGCIRLQHIKPASEAIPGSIRVTKACSRAMNEQLAKVAVPALAGERVKGSVIAAAGQYLPALVFDLWG
ncbi:hypothetical protein [Mesorhizobium sp. WSM3862]|uniref:hypothetical protein n=1 Tax=Mesorhizobium sp. WSM3862 TaxID=632858 RepID=UPI0032B01DA1